MQLERTEANYSWIIAQSKMSYGPAGVVVQELNNPFMYSLHTAAPTTTELQINSFLLIRVP